MKPRVNARGEWRCLRCDLFLPRDAYRVRRSTGNPESYCRACYLEYMKQYHRMKPESRERQAARYPVDQRRRVRAWQARRDFAIHAVRVLIHRGMNYSDISRTVGMTRATVTGLAKGETTKVKRLTVDKLSHALIVTAQEGR